MSTRQQFEIRCSPEEAFEKFTNGKEIVDWWGDPDVYRTISWIADLRSGGHWRAEFKAPDGTCFGAGGIYLSVDRPEQLKWTWKADWEPDTEKTILMNFMRSVVGTDLIIETTGHRSDEAKAQDEAAWATIVDWFSRATGRHR